MGQFNPFENSGNGSGDIDTSAYATDIAMSIDSKTYIMYTHLKNEVGGVIGREQKIDLPLETMVVGGSYDDSTKKVILTLRNGNTVDFSVADLVEGLQSEITSTNKLNSDLVDDTNQNNKFVTSAEKTKIASALTVEVYNAGKTTPYGTQYVIEGETYTVEDNAEIFNNYDNNKAVGECSHAEGGYTKAIGAYSHAEGNSTKASGSFSHAEGTGAKATGNTSHAEGGGTKAIGAYSHAEGGGTTASGDNSHAEGGGTTANGSGSHVEGNGTTANGSGSHAEGSGTTANGSGSHAEGEFTNANGRNAHTEGFYTIASSNNQHVQGKYNIEDSNSKYAFIIGNGTANNNRSNAFAIDWNGLIYVNNASTGINISQLLTEEVYNAGKQVTTDGKIGEIFNEYAYNKATGADSHAEGGGTTASGYYSHAEGAGTTASGECSHTEGSGTIASGERSHAEGVTTIASGDFSHAEGANTTASGYESHAEGNGSIAASACQHAQGKFNIEDTNSKYAFIIGNGTNNNNRSNAFAVDWNGLIYVNNASTGVNVSQLQPIINSSNKISADFIDDSSSINKFGLPTIDIDFSKSDIDTIPEDKRYLIQENKSFAFRNIAEGAYSEYLYPLNVTKQTTETGGLWACELQINSHYYASIFINLATFTYLVQYYYLGTLNIDDSGSPNKFMTVDEKTKLAGIETGANKITVDSALDSASVNPVRNSAIYTALSNKVDKVTGKQLSTEDFTTAEKTKLAGLQNYNDASCIKNIFGTSLANGDDLNTYTTSGTYSCTSGIIASSLVNCPYTGSGFRLDVFQTSSVNFLKQIVQPNQADTDSNIYHRTYAVSTNSWSVWYKLTSEALS